METNVEKTLYKLEHYQAILIALDAKYRHATQLSGAAKWLSVAAAAITASKLVPHVSYHEIGVVLSGVAAVGGLLSFAIWLEQRGKVATLIKESWTVLERATQDGVNLGSDGRILRDELGRPINPFAPVKHRT